MKKLFIILVCIAITAFWVGLSQAAEHLGEHPGTPAKSEHQ